MLTQNIKTKRTKDPICSFLKNLISPYGFGWEENLSVGRYSNDQLIRWYNTHSFMGTPTNGDIYAHFAGQQTLYFWADGRMSTPQTLTMIDIDCHQRGSAWSAKAFADWLSQNGFPDLYHEPSTHGTGRHGYFVLSKEMCNDRAVCHILKRLDNILKKLLQVFLATHPEHEIENVEIKGTPHVITWAKGARRQIESMKSGDLAKLPRDILNRFEEFKNTTVLSFQDIDELEAKVDRMVIPGPRKLSVVKAKGSTPNHPIPKDELEAIGGPYLDFARSWVPESVGTSSRAKVEAADLAIGLAIVKFCTSKPNRDGTMPTMRIKAIWDKLFENDEVERAFDYHRWRVVRDLIEVQGGLEIVDRRFFTEFVNEVGRVIRGRAAKWYMAEWLVEKLDEIVITGCRIADTGYKDVGLSACHNQGGTLLNNESDNRLISLPYQDQGGTLLEQQDKNQEETLILLPEDRQGGTLLEQEEQQDEDYGFDDNWIIEFRQPMLPVIGLIWGGTIENIRREAG
jgi:hypothetical protein